LGEEFQIVEVEGERCRKVAQVSAVYF